MSGHLAFRPQPLGSNYSVHLPAYEGPLDLLLHLIETQELDISAISLVAVTDQYLQTMAQLEEIEPGALADFLIVASRLLYIKSYHLLPKPRPASEDDEDEASGDALVRQLLEYRQFKEIAGLLRTREQAGLRVYVRAAPRPEVPRRLDLDNMDVGRLQAALRKVLQRMPVDPPLPRVKTYAITVSEQIENVRSLLRSQTAAAAAGSKRAQLSFYTLLSQSASRLEVVVTFLAVLELYKLGEIEVLQEGTFADIYLIPSEPHQQRIYDSRRHRVRTVLKRQVLLQFCAELRIVTGYRKLRKLGRYIGRRAVEDPTVCFRQHACVVIGVAHAYREKAKLLECGGSFAFAIIRAQTIAGEHALVVHRETVGK